MCVGGSQALARGLIEDITDHGGRLMLGTPIRKIVVEGGRAIGIETGAGDFLRARHFVASGLNPHQTFLELIDGNALPSGVAEAASKFRYNLLAPLFSLNVALDEPPAYRAANLDPDLDRAFMVILGLERYGQFSEIVSAHEMGRVPSTVMWGCCPTRFDPSQAPPGRHTAFMWEKLPYKLDGDARNWDAARRRHGCRMLDLWADYAPNLSRGAVRDWFCRSPLDTERTLPNMRFGDLLVGSLGDGQVGWHRPFAGAGEYRTPVPGLYVCGGSTHPGGNVTGLCGYNAARVLAADLDVKPWWNPPSLPAP
jgi:phytoene dehydrogenase-like protein